MEERKVSFVTSELWILTDVKLWWKRGVDRVRGQSCGSEFQSRSTAAGNHLKATDHEPCPQPRFSPFFKKEITVWAGWWTQCFHYIKTLSYLSHSRVIWSDGSSICMSVNCGSTLERRLKFGQFHFGCNNNSAASTNEDGAMKSVHI